jgi:hypothetical protein
MYSHSVPADPNYDEDEDEEGDDLDEEDGGAEDYEDDNNNMRGAGTESVSAYAEQGPISIPISIPIQQ